MVKERLMFKFFYTSILLFLLSLPLEVVGVTDNKGAVVPKRFELAVLHIDIDGKGHNLFAGQTAYVLPGQKVTVKDAELKSHYKASYINVVGLTHSIPGQNSLDDRGVTFESGELLEKWAIGSGKDTFAIQVKKKSYLSGEVFLRVIKPQIDYVEVLINGKKRILRNQDILTLSRTDKFKVGFIKSNFENVSEVDYKLIPLHKSKQVAQLGGLSSDYKYFELIFTFKNNILITFPMRVMN